MNHSLAFASCCIGVTLLGVSPACSSKLVKDGRRVTASIGGIGGDVTGTTGMGGSTTAAGTVIGLGSTGTGTSGDTSAGDPCGPARKACNGACVALESDPAHCGACGNACADGDSCVQSLCTCGGGLVDCDGQCVDPSGDVANCGECGNACDGAEGCVSGACSCPSGTLECGGVCTDTRVDRANCGECGTTCSSGASCVEGGCSCDSGRTQCDDACVDTEVDAAHCGACGNTCAAGEVCSLGDCSTEGCEEGLEQCGQSCVDTTQSPDFCGNCTTSCAPGQQCSDGACECPEAQLECDGQCVNTAVNVNHCGACDAVCQGGQGCSDGVCTCPGGREWCDGSCVDTHADNDQHCGGCQEACEGQQSCSNGECACPSGQTACGTLCVDTDTNTSHCGACGSACATGSCVNGACGGQNTTSTTSATNTSSSTTTGGTICSESWGGSSDGSVTWYTFAQGTPDDVNCSFGIQTSPDRVNHVFTGGGQYFGAMNTADYDTAATCGACVELERLDTGQAVTVTIVDQCPIATNPKCVAGHIDLSQAAFLELGSIEEGYLGARAGLGQITWTYVPCPTSGNVEFRLKEPSNAGWNQVIVEAHKTPLSSVQVQVNGVWVDAVRQEYNFWEPPGGNMGTPPYLVRAIDINGDSVQGSLSLTSGSQESDQQFSCN